MFPETVDNLKPLVENLYYRARSIAKKRKHNVWDLPFKELLDLNPVFEKIDFKSIEQNVEEIK